MTKGGVKVAKEAEDMDLVEEKEEDPEEGTVITLPIMKREVKVHNPQEREWRWKSKTTLQYLFLFFTLALNLMDAMGYV